METPKRVWLKDQHGTLSSYKSGCHCEACTEANRAYDRARTRPRVLDRLVFRLEQIGGEYLSDHHRERLIALLAAGSPARLTK